MDVGAKNINMQNKNGYFFLLMILLVLSVKVSAQQSLNIQDVKESGLAEEFNSKLDNPACTNGTCVLLLSAHTPLPENEWKILAVSLINELRKDIASLKDDSFFSFEHIISFVSLLVSIFASYIAWSIGKNLSFKKDLNKKQLETVFQLVEHLQKLNIFFFYNLDRAGGDIFLPFFEMTIEKHSTLEQFSDSDYVVYVSNDLLYEHEVMGYVNNPFLPKTIADCLIKLYPRGGDEFTFRGEENSIYISSHRGCGDQKYRKECSQYYKSIRLLFESAQQVSESITQWLKSVDANDLNIRHNLISLENYP